MFLFSSAFVGFFLVFVVSVVVVVGVAGTDDARVRTGFMQHMLHYSRSVLSEEVRQVPSLLPLTYPPRLIGTDRGISVCRILIC